MKNHYILRGLIFTALILTLVGGTAFFTPESDAADRVYYDQSLPGRCEVTPGYENEKDYVLTKEEAAGCRDKMDKLIKILKETGPLAAPKGFLASILAGYVPPNNWYQQFQPPYKNHRVRTQLFTRLSGLFLVNGKLVPEDEPPVFSVYFNNIMPLAKDWTLCYEGIWDEQGRLFFTEPIAAGQYKGRTVYEGRTVVLTRGSKPLWIPISQEQFLRGQIKLNLDKKKRTPDDSTCDTIVEYLNQELSQLNPVERKTPAYYNSGSDNPTGLVAKDDEQASAVVALNPAYFDPARPRTAVQLIVVQYRYSGQLPKEGMTFREDGTNVTMYEIEKSLNYDAIASLLDGPK